MQLKWNENNIYNLEGFYCLTKENIKDLRYKENFSLFLRNNSSDAIELFKSSSENVVNKVYDFIINSKISKEKLISISFHECSLTEDKIILSRYDFETSRNMVVEIIKGNLNDLRGEVTCTFNHSTTSRLKSEDCEI